MGAIRSGKRIFGDVAKYIILTAPWCFFGLSCMAWWIPGTWLSPKRRGQQSAALRSCPLLSLSASVVIGHSVTIGWTGSFRGTTLVRLQTVSTVSTLGHGNIWNSNDDPTEETSVIIPYWRMTSYRGHGAKPRRAEGTRGANLDWNWRKPQWLWVTCKHQMAMAAMGQEDVRPSTSGPPGMEGPLGRLQPRSTGGARSCTLLGSEHLGFRKISRKHTSKLSFCWWFLIRRTRNISHKRVQDSENSVRWKIIHKITLKQPMSQIISHYLSPFVTQKAFGFRISRRVAEAKILWPADMPDDMLEDAVTGNRRWLGTEDDWDVTMVK